MKYISVSQIKTANGSLAKWAGSYILGIKDTFFSDALPLGNLFEDYLITGKDNFDRHLKKDELQNLEALMKDYDNLKHNCEGLNVPKGEYQYKVTGDLFGIPFYGYADIFTDDCIYDVKTCRYLSKPESESVNHWSGMSTMDEYKLQLRAYMKATGVKKGKILEISKHKYADGRNAHQVIDIDYSDGLEQEMIEKFGPLVEEMKSLSDKFKNV